MSKKTKLIAVGEVGTSFVSLTEKEIAALKLNGRNKVCAKVRLSAEQMERYKKGGRSGVLWVDSASWLSSRDGEFWLGTLEQAIAEKLVVKASVKIKSGDKIKSLTGFVRSSWSASEKFDHAIAVESGGVNGRIEARQVSDKRNALYVRQIEEIVVK
jgi:hypothetical protein